MATDDLTAVIARVRSGRGVGSDFNKLLGYLKNPDDDPNRLYEAVTNYLKYSDHVDWSIARTYVDYPLDPMIAATTISMASIGGCPDDRFWQSVLKIAGGVSWDPENDARIQAILALSRMPGGCPEARSIIRDNLVSDSESVRDSAAVAAQRCFGRNEPDMVYEGPSGRLIESVGSDVLNWIWPERESNHRTDLR
jgi:hypothetical protein